MVKTPSIKGFLKVILGLDRPQTQSIELTPTEAPAVNPAPLPVTAPKTPKPKSEAYLNRHKGRTAHGNTLGYLKTICPYLVSKGEVSPGEMIKDLGLPKSTLIYNLNTLLDYCHKPQTDRFRARMAETIVNDLLKGHRVVRVGAGKYVRYRLVTVPPDLTAEPPAET
jgi:hypothetical protein